MNYVLNYLLDYFRYQLSTVLAGRKNYDRWKQEYYSLKEVRLANAKLAAELEAVCQANGGVLTMAEFLTIDQFGKHGYHLNNWDNGMTQTHKWWAKALVTFCQENNISQIVEFGPGNGKLAIETLKRAKKKHLTLHWGGVEINPLLCKQIKEAFHKEKLTSQLDFVSETIDAVPMMHHGILVCSYSLDNMPPQVMLTTGNQPTMPNALLGVQVKSGILSEVILDKTVLQKKKLSLEKGIYHNHHLSFDVSSWALHPGQRAFISFDAYETVYKLVKKLDQQSYLLVIDEFRPPPYPWETRHLCVPKDLHRFKRDVDAMEKLYREAGQHLYYYPMFYQTFYKFLHAVGFSTMQEDVEQRLARTLSHDSFFPKNDVYFTHAFLASGKRQVKQTIFPLAFPHQQLVR